MKVIILDDQFNSLGFLIEKCFANLGHKTTAYLRPEQALQHLRDVVSKKEPKPDVCFFDIDLNNPDLTGIDMAEKVLKEFQIPVVLYSQHASSKTEGGRYANMVEAAGIPRRFYVGRGDLEIEEKLRQLLEDVEENYEHPDISPILNETVFDLNRLRIGFRHHDNEFHFVSKEEIIYLDGNGDLTMVYCIDRSNNNLIRFNIAQNIGGNNGSVLGIGDKVKRVFRNIHPIKGGIKSNQNGAKETGQLFINLEKIIGYNETEGVLKLEHGIKIYLTATGKRQFKALKLLITTVAENR